MNERCLLVRENRQASEGKIKLECPLVHGYLHGWLAHHRRTVYIAIAHEIGEPGENIASDLKRLIGLLLSATPGESQVEKEKRRVPWADRAAIFAMLQWAEAWLSAAQARRNEWSGANVDNRKIAKI